MGYRVLYGGSTFSSFAKHPEKVIVKRYTSAAAGAYQFLPGTWKMASSKLGLGDFGPRNQDQAALFLIERRNALAMADQGELTPQLLAKLAPEWASLPTLQAKSFYGQPVKKAPRPQGLLRKEPGARTPPSRWHGANQPAAELDQAERGSASISAASSSPLKR